MRFGRGMGQAICGAVILAGCCLAAGGQTEGASVSMPPPTAEHQNFHVAVYIPISIVEHMRDRAWLESSWQQISSQVKVDKVYIETYRSRRFADAELIEQVKKFFRDHGVEVAGGIAYSDADARQFVSFSYTDAADRAYVKKVAEFTAKHFDNIILDDFFFNNTKTPGDIAAKGNQSWSEFRMKLMDGVSRDLVVGPARAVNPKVKVVIKFPNWYPDFHENGYDLEVEPKIFSGIYTGTETRDPVTTDQNLQQYESFQIIRYFDNVAPGRNGGGWVDTFDVRYVDRYAEQLWDTMLAKAPQIVLFEYSNLLKPAEPGNRDGWAGLHTTFDYDAYFGANPSTPPNYAAIAGHALAEVDPLVGKLGNPVGIDVYRPYHSTGEKFLENYLGMIGIPINMHPEFPKGSKMVLLTESAQKDPNIVAEIKAQLLSGGNVAMTSGLLKALEPRGIDSICDLKTTDRKLVIDRYWGNFGAGGGANLGEDEAAKVMVPAMDFATNDAWPVVRGTANGYGAPLLLMDAYGKGTLFVLTIPDNFRDLYRIPAPALSSIKGYLMQNFPVTMDAPGEISLMPYDNGTFVVESYREAPQKVTVSVLGTGKKLKNLLTGEEIEGQPMTGNQISQMPDRQARTSFSFTILPHSYAGFGVE